MSALRDWLFPLPPPPHGPEFPGTQTGPALPDLSFQTILVFLFVLWAYMQIGRMIGIHAWKVHSDEKKRKGFWGMFWFPISWAFDSWKEVGTALFDTPGFYKWGHSIVWPLHLAWSVLLFACLCSCYAVFGVFKFLPYIMEPKRLWRALVDLHLPVRIKNKLKRNKPAQIRVDDGSSPDTQQQAKEERSRALRTQINALQGELINLEAELELATGLRGSSALVSNSK